MAGFNRPSTSSANSKEDVDAGAKPGHDGEVWCQIELSKIVVERARE